MKEGGNQERRPRKHRGLASNIQAPADFCDITSFLLSLMHVIATEIMVPIARAQIPYVSVMRDLPKQYLFIVAHPHDQSRMIIDYNTLFPSCSPFRSSLYIYTILLISNQVRFMIFHLGFTVLEDVGNVIGCSLQIHGTRLKSACSLC